MGKNFIHPSLGFFIERTKKKGVTPHLVHTKLFCDTISMNWRNWMMTKSGNWLGNGWKNGWRLGRKGSGDWIG